MPELRLKGIVVCGCGAAPAEVQLQCRLWWRAVELTLAFYLQLQLRLGWVLVTPCTSNVLLAQQPVRRLLTCRAACPQTTSEADQAHCGR